MKVVEMQGVVDFQFARAFQSPESCGKFLAQVLSKADP
jgi:hypothetical protein